MSNLAIHNYFFHTYFFHCFQVNDRFAAMEDLIAENIRTLRKDLRIAEFQTDTNYWKSCIKAGDVEEANTCQQEAYRRSSSKSPQYAPFYTEWEDGNGVIFDDESKFRKAEVNLLTFRNYGQLNIMILLTLIQTYDGEDEVRTMNYRKELHTWIEFCHGYLTWSIEQVTKAYVEFEYAAECVHDEDVTNWLGYVYSKEYTCSARLGYTYSKNADCLIEVSENRHVNLPDGYTDCCGGEKIGKNKLKTKFDSSFPQEKASITNYMTSEFTDVLSKWKEIQSTQGKAGAKKKKFKATNVGKGKGTYQLQKKRSGQSRRKGKTFFLQSGNRDYQEDELKDDDGSIKKNSIE